MGVNAMLSLSRKSGEFLFLVKDGILIAMIGVTGSSKDRVKVLVDIDKSVDVIRQEKTQFKGMVISDVVKIPLGTRIISEP